MADKQMPSLDGLIQSKGAARPNTLAQRGDAPTPRAVPASPARALQAALAPRLIAVEKEPRAKSLTLRLSESQYERLRQFAFDRRVSHQDVIERALLDLLEREEAAQ